MKLPSRKELAPLEEMQKFMEGANKLAADLNLYPKALISALSTQLVFAMIEFCDGLPLDEVQSKTHSIVENLFKEIARRQSNN